MDTTRPGNSQDAHVIYTKLLVEGHYIQIWSHHNWRMYLPFIGESHIFSIEVDNMEFPNSDPHASPTSPVSVDKTPRDL